MGWYTVSWGAREVRRRERAEPRSLLAWCGRCQPAASRIKHLAGLSADASTDRQAGAGLSGLAELVGAHETAGARLA